MGITRHPAARIGDIATAAQITERALTGLETAGSNVFAIPMRDIHLVSETNEG